jgi:cysteine desulfurase
MKKSIYLDHHATTPVDPRVLERMLPYFSERFGNAASRSHRFGWEAERAVERARRQIAALAGATPREIIFTSGATESNNLALKGVMEACRSRGTHLVTMATEHRAVLDPARRLEREGFRLTVLAPEPDGLLSLDRLRQTLSPDTVLVSVMAANNEIGVIQPLGEIGAICRERGILFHSDAAQAFGKIAIDVERDSIDLLSITAHKLYGPKGAGALYVRRRNPRVPLAAQMDGGGHEGGMRSGTLNVAAVVGFGEACALAAEEMAGEAERLAGLRDRLRQRLEEDLDGVHVNGSLEHRLAGNLNVSFEGVEGDALLMAMPELALSTGSACSSATVEPSHVLRALGAGGERARGALRIGMGRGTTAEEIEYAGERIVEAVRKLRALRPLGYAPSMAH